MKDNSHPSTEAFHLLPTEDANFNDVDDLSDEEWSIPNGTNSKTPLKGKEGPSCKTRLLLLAGIAVVVLAVMCGVAFWLGTSRKNKVCLTRECIEASAYILSAMDTNADPCSDFYQYACGGWINKSIALPSYSKFTRFSIVNLKISRRLLKLITSPVTGTFRSSTAIEKAKKYYTMCMNTDAIEAAGTQPLEKLIRDLGHWALTGNRYGTWDAGRWSLTDALKASLEMGFSPFFGLYVAGDEKNRTTYRIQFIQYGLTFESHKLYIVNNTQTRLLRQAYISAVVQFASFLEPTNDTSTQAEEMYEFEKGLAQIYHPHEGIANPEDDYHKMTLADFQNLIGRRSMLLIKPLLDGLFHRNTPQTEQVIVHDKSFFASLSSLLNKYRDRPRVLANYLVFHCVSQLSLYIPQRFEFAVMKLWREFTGVSYFPARWKSCVSSTDMKFQFATGALYIKEYFPDHQRKTIDDMHERIRQAFLDKLPHQTWMSHKVKLLSRHKARAMSRKVAYPGKYMNVSILDEYYKDMHISEGFLQTMLNYKKDIVSKMVDHYWNPPDKHQWTESPISVNAFYSSSNDIVIPAGIMNRPFFDETFPTPYQFGSIGFIIGHEFTHGFDAIGRKYDKDGNLKEMWETFSEKAFKELADCFIHQYGAYAVNGQHMNGNLTLSENLADNGGLGLVYNAYQNWERSGNSNDPPYPNLPTSPSQLLYLGFAQVWCSIYQPKYIKTSISIDVHTYSPFRVKGALTNMPQFAEAFNCPRGSPMNPQHKCSLW